MRRAAFLSAALCGVAASAASSSQWPLVSVNQVDLWWRYLVGDGAGAKAAAAEACARGFTTMRVAGSAFWPSEMTWVNNSDAYWSLFDTMVADAGEVGCFLIPSVFWNVYLFSDLASEPFSQMRNTSSVSYRLSMSYLTQMITRYANNPTIAAWEIGNEHNLFCDLNMTGRTDICAPGMGTPAFRTSADNCSTADMVALQSQVAAVIRANDKLNRPISTGHAVPRPQAWHLQQSYYNPYQDWSNDTVAQFTDILVQVSQPADFVTVHIYPGADNARWGNTDHYSLDLVVATAAAAKQAGKPMYLGEFGDAAGPGGNRTFTALALKQLLSIGVDFATVWVWQLGEQNSTYSLYPGADDAIIATMQACNTPAGC
jgi:hypothetical protein